MEKRHTEVRQEEEIKEKGGWITRVERGEKTLSGRIHLIYLYLSIFPQKPTEVENRVNSSQHIRTSCCQNRQDPLANINTVLAGEQVYETW
jgi:hypothetical protein